MNQSQTTNIRVLGIAPSSRGFGFAIMEGETLVDWGVKSVMENKNEGSLAKIADLIAQYEPALIVLEDAKAEEVRRAARIRASVRENRGTGNRPKAQSETILPQANQSDIFLGRNGNKTCGRPNPSGAVSTGTGIAAAAKAPSLDERGLPDGHI